MSRTMRNAVRPHEMTAPCRMKCGNEAVPQLQGGQIVKSPICETCREKLDAEFKRASIQRSKQQPAAKQPSRPSKGKSESRAA
jgi:hypothetical protein